MKSQLRNARDGNDNRPFERHAALHGESSSSEWRPRRGVPGTPVPVGKCRRAQLPRRHPGSAETDLRLARGESGVSKHATHTSGSSTGHCGLIKEGTRPVFCNPEHAAGSTWGLCPAEETLPEIPLLVEGQGTPRITTGCRPAAEGTGS